MSVAVCCSVLQRAAMCCKNWTISHPNIFWPQSHHTVTNYSLLQHTATITATIDNSPGKLYLETLQQSQKRKLNEDIFCLSIRVGVYFLSINIRPGPNPILNLMWTKENSNVLNSNYDFWNWLETILSSFPNFLHSACQDWLFLCIFSKIAASHKIDPRTKTNLPFPKLTLMKPPHLSPPTALFYPPHFSLRPHHHHPV